MGIFDQMNRFVIRQTKSPARIIPKPSEPLKRKSRVAVKADYDSKKEKRISSSMAF